MGSRNVGCSGYVLRASELARVLAPDKQDEYMVLLSQDKEPEVILDWLRDNLPAGVVRPSEMFMTREDIFDTDEMEMDELYALFNEDDLYMRIPTSGFTELMSRGVKPEQCSWVVFCYESN